MSAGWDTAMAGRQQRRHPELSIAEARQAVLDRIWGADLAAAVRRTRAER